MAKTYLFEIPKQLLFDLVYVVYFIRHYRLVFSKLAIIKYPNFITAQYKSFLKGALHSLIADRNQLVAQLTIAINVFIAEMKQLGFKVPFQSVANRVRLQVLAACQGGLPPGQPYSVQKRGKFAMFSKCKSYGINGEPCSKCPLTIVDVNKLLQPFTNGKTPAVASVVVNPMMVDRKRKKVLRKKKTTPKRGETPNPAALADASEPQPGPSSSNSGQQQEQQQQPSGSGTEKKLPEKCEASQSSPKRAKSETTHSSSKKPKDMRLYTSSSEDELEKEIRLWGRRGNV